MTSLNAQGEPRPLGSFVGRERELAELRLALGDMTAGHGHLFLLSGEPGIGKTRLADEFGRLALAQGVRVAWGRCWEGGGAPAYWPWIQVVRACLTGTDAEQRAVILTAEATPQVAQDVAQLLPELRAAHPTPRPPGPQPTDPEQARFQLFESVATFLRNAARIAPLLIVIDDLHEADQPSLQMLRFVARETKAARIMMLGTYRDAEVKHLPELGQLIGHLIREGSTLPLAGLSKTEVRQFVEQSSGQKAKEKLVADLYEATNGNPLFVDGVVRLLIAGGKVDSGSNEFEIPDGVRVSIRRRLAALSSETKTLLSIASMIGTEFDVRSLELVSGSPAVQIVERLEDPGRIGIVSGSGSLPRQYRFSHALVREALYRDLPASRRIELHGQIGAAIEKIHGDDLKPHQAALAYHFSMAGIKEKAIRYSIGAGQAASEVFAYHQARSHWEAALELLQGEVASSAHRARLLLRLASLCWMIDYGAGIRYAKAALSIFESLEREEQAAECHAALGIFYAVTGQETSDISHAREHFRKAEATLSKGPERPNLARLYTGISQTAFASRRTEEGLAAGQRAMEIAEGFNDDAAWAAAAIQYATHLVVSARLAESRSLLDQAWQIADRLNLAHLASIATWTAGRCWVLFLDSPEALRWYQRELGKPRVENYRPLLLELLGEALARAGDLDGARRLSAGTAQAQILAGLLFYEGTWDRAEAFIKDQALRLRHSGDLASLSWCLNILGNIYRLCGRPHEALAVFEEHFSIAGGESQPVYEVLIRPVLAMTRVEMGQLTAAKHELVRCREVMASGEDWRGLAGGAVLAEAVVAAAEGSFQNAEAQFEKAAEIFRRHQVPFEEAEACYYYGRALYALGQHDRADQKLDAAIAIYRRCGAGEQWLKRAEAARGPAQALRRLSSEGTELQTLAPSEALFRYEGDYWTLTYRGKTSRLKDAKGFHYLANLLARPGIEIRALDLVVLSGSASVEAVEIAQASEVTRSQTVAREFGHAGEVLDAQAKAAYKRRLTELRQKLEDARELGDEEHAEEAEEEIRALGRELKSAVGLSGRTGRAASSSERARLAVTLAIRFALGEILKNDAELSKLLAAAIKTGTVCSYLPPAGFPLRWRL